MATEKTKPKAKGIKVEKERREFKALIAENPNYFGTLPGIRKKSVKKMTANTKYEEIRCVGFYPELDLLEAIIDIKLPNGYKGDLCSNGSFEYIRFFIDWNGDGDFSDPEEDVGITAVNVHDIPNEKYPCLKKTKPLSYALTLKINPKKRLCKFPNMVKLRAILSWENPPTAGNPNFSVVWGNVVEQWIQIKPVDFKLKDVTEFIDFKKVKLTESMLDLDTPISKNELLTPEDLKKIYKKKDVPEHRFNFSAIYQVAEQIKKTPSVLAEYELDPQFKIIKKSVQALLKSEFNTNYEELSCIGLNYDLDQLVATITIKRPCGYSGDLCANGSDEHIAFWAYVYDEIEQTCLWKSLGITSVNVHDIKMLPKEGLQYAVYLPVDLSSLREHCSQPEVIRIRGILSWNAKPDPVDPYQIPAWGNRLDTLIQIKPGSSVQPGERRPFIWAVGQMAVESVSGNPYTILPSTLGDGYANGVSLGGGFTAVESPFGGKIAISGKITNAPDNPAPGNKLKYKVQYKKSGGIWKDIEDKFRIWLRIDGVPSGYLVQVANSGYFTYESDDALGSTSPKVEVQNDMLAVWHTPVSDGNGLYTIRVLLHEPGALPQPGVPANHIASEEVKITIDNSKPTAAISLDMGACQKFNVGDTITGKFTAIDPHIWKYTIAVLPASAPNPPVITPSSSVYPIFAAPGVTNATFTLTTTAGTTPCGYVLRLWVRDRAIVDNHFPGNWMPADVGFCLLEKKEGNDS